MKELVSNGDPPSRLTSNILEIVEQRCPARLRQYQRGQFLYMQGDPADCVFVLKTGAVKVFSISPEGKSYTWDILEPGRLPGMVAALVGRAHESSAEAALDTTVYAIPLAEFQQIMASNPRVSGMLMQSLARTVDSLSADIRSLCALNVQQRLKYGLVKLAERHGIATGKGIKINLEITHEELASLIAADRSTVTVSLNLLKRQGYLWKEGDNLVILPPHHIALLDGLTRAVQDGDDREAVATASRLAEAGVTPVVAVDAMARAIQEVGQGLSRNNLALSDVLLAVDAMKSAMMVLDEKTPRTKRRAHTAGRVVIGTVRGDIHDIGKTVVSALLEANGFEVIDLGVDIAATAFVEAVAQYQPHILALSTFLTTSAGEPGQIIELLHTEGLRDEVKVMTGGNAMTRELTREIGADGYSASGSDVVSMARRLTRTR